jgi:hypothetical protein
MTVQPILTEAGLSPELVDLLKLVLRNTYYSVEGCAQVLQLQRGSRPGNSLADIMFGYIAVDYTSMIWFALADLGIDTRIPSSDGNPLIFPVEAKQSQIIGGQTYVDDTAIYVMAENLQQLITTNRQTLTQVVDCIMDFGVTRVHKNRLC